MLLGSVACAHAHLLARVVISNLIVSSTKQSFRNIPIDTAKWYMNHEKSPVTNWYI